MCSWWKGGQPQQAQMRAGRTLTFAEGLLLCLQSLYPVLGLLIYKLERTLYPSDPNHQLYTILSPQLKGNTLWLRHHQQKSIVND